MHNLYERIQRGAKIAAALSLADPVYRPILDRMLSEADLVERAKTAPNVAARIAVRA